MASLMLTVHYCGLGEEEIAGAAVETSARGFGVKEVNLGLPVGIGGVVHDPYGCVDEPGVVENLVLERQIILGER